MNLAHLQASFRRMNTDVQTAASQVELANVHGIQTPLIPIFPSEFTTIFHAIYRLPPLTYFLFSLQASYVVTPVRMEGFDINVRNYCYREGLCSPGA
jgi:hypothetical protein